MALPKFRGRLAQMPALAYYRFGETQVTAVAKHGFLNRLDVMSSRRSGPWQRVKARLLAGHRRYTEPINRLSTGWHPRESHLMYLRSRARLSRLCVIRRLSDSDLEFLEPFGGVRSKNTRPRNPSDSAILLRLRQIASFLFSHPA